MKPFDVEQAKIGAAEIAKKHGLNLVVLFGSQATGRIHEKSDVDIAILGEQALPFDAQTKIWGDFSDAFKRDDIEVVDLAPASPTMMYVVVRDGRALYEDAVGRFDSWKLFAMREWRDTAWLRALRDRKLTEWAKAA